MPKSPKHSPNLMVVKGSSRSSSTSFLYNVTEPDKTTYIEVDFSMF